MFAPKLAGRVPRGRVGGLRCLATHAHYDIVIAGGGLVGCAMAAACQSSPVLQSKSVLVLENGPDRPYHLPEDYGNRVIALNNSTRDLFQHIHVWAPLTASRMKTVHGMHVWEATPESLLTFQSDQPDRGHFYILENDLVVHTLSQKIRQSPGHVRVVFDSGLKSGQYNQARGQMDLALSDGRSVSTSLLIGADGVNSTVRKSMTRQQYLSRNYHQFGVVGLLSLAEPIPNNMAWQKFLPGGPVALLPLSETRSSLVWTLPSHQAQNMLKSPPAVVLAALQEALRPYPVVSDPFPRFSQLSQLAGFPLGLGHASRYCAPGQVLIGDAAHRVHPLAGQGVNLGFGDVRALVRALETSVLNGERFATYRSLLAYETDRQRYNVPMMLGIDFLQKIYGSQNPVVAAARNFGLGVVQAHPSVQKLLASFAN
ncbi:hypothetical protein TCAL_05048 [Tigriopus californicus]|uniref:FAD-binding domain-containing protein n=1 Tax=Tigriopus californicus TaxID=6832 RepID=A0A553P8N3_TIGCA|nr:ubiquinone biosynthesis monooxygenase COQ6, mitochondrial-like [Tigriopus californicus]TRY74038.1 hypothetical protein TCAL_05048 [Tigriopus californicus]